jgi:hypothetical protein
VKPWVQLPGLEGGWEKWREAWVVEEGRERERKKQTKGKKEGRTNLQFFMLGIEPKALLWWESAVPLSYFPRSPHTHKLAIQRRNSISMALLKTNENMCTHVYY